MPRRPRIAPGGLVYHVLNRAVARLALFENDADYEAFERAENCAPFRPPRAKRLRNRQRKELRPL